MEKATQRGHNEVMDELTALVEIQGFFTRAQARDAGVDDRHVAPLLRSGAWRRIRRGYFTDGPTWAALDPTARHLVRCRAVMHSLGDGVALSHVSGLLVHGIATWGVSLERVHVTRLDKGAGRIEPDVVHHRGRCLNGDVVEVAGLRVLSPDRCAIEASIRATNESALVHLDSLLHLGLADEDTLMRRFQTMGHWPGVRHLHLPVRMADGGAESPGESRGRWLFHVLRVPPPEVQFEVKDSAGTVVGVCDWAWPEHECLGEFDGRIKYGRLLKPGQDAGEVVFAEKVREDLLRELTDYRMLRLIWDDYGRPRVTGSRIRQQLRLAS